MSLRIPDDDKIFNSTQFKFPKWFLAVWWVAVVAGLGFSGFIGREIYRLVIHFC